MKANNLIALMRKFEFPTRPELRCMQIKDGKARLTDGVTLVETPVAYDFTAYIPTDVKSIKPEQEVNIAQDKTVINGISVPHIEDPNFPEYAQIMPKIDDSTLICAIDLKRLKACISYLEALGINRAYIHSAGKNEPFAFVSEGTTALVMPLYR